MSQFVVLDRQNRPTLLLDPNFSPGWPYYEPS
jgi:hypothetical protein